MLWLASIVKLLAEVALMALIGRAVLGLLAGEGRGHNVFYRLLDTVCRPVLRLARAAAPAALHDRHLTGLSIAVLALVWVLALAWKVSICLRIGLALCR